MADDIEQSLSDLQQEVALIRQHLEASTRTLDRLYQLLVGNGDDRSVIIRLNHMEQTQEVHRQELHEVCTAVNRIGDEQDARRNQAIGIAIAISIVWTVAIAILSFLL